MATLFAAVALPRFGVNFFVAAQSHCGCMPMVCGHTICSTIFVAINFFMAAIFQSGSTQSTSVSVALSHRFVINFFVVAISQRVCTPRNTINFTSTTSGSAGSLGVSCDRPDQFQAFPSALTLPKTALSFLLLAPLATSAYSTGSLPSASLPCVGMACCTSIIMTVRIWCIRDLITPQIVEK